jgi:DNA-binding transcriptional LysR family regulator
MSFLNNPAPRQGAFSRPATFNWKAGRITADSIELRDFRLAVIASQHRSLRQAAEAMGIRQSILNRRIRDLESRLGTVLFERTNGGTRPTVAGLKFVELADRVLEDAETALRSVRSQSRGEQGKLTLGVYASFATGNMYASLVDYHERFPDVDVHTVDGSQSRLTRALGRDAIDVAIMANFPSGWNDRALSLWSERVNRDMDVDIHQDVGEGKLVNGEP